MSNIIVISAPSGSGKTTVINHLLEVFNNLEFSISATSRTPRENEKDGLSYHFLSYEDFQKKILNGEFIEWEEVYDGSMYGTLTSEVERICQSGKVALFDLDVYGALNIKKKFKNAFLIFILPPSIEDLKERLERRASETSEAIDKRLSKAKEEMLHALKFDYILLNDDINETLLEAERIIDDFLERKIVPDTFRIVD
ncbi:MAG: guanylate kinase [Prevotellaceae bacterium]|jgi:guanylate kinase|nr:guanylate kinase [Prevotellaceae bacterium]